MRQSQAKKASARGAHSREEDKGHTFEAKGWLGT